jgi:multidrug efflux pump subunit AcrB
MGFFFVQLKPWDERTRPEARPAVVIRAQPGLRQQIPEAMVGAFGPPAIPGLGTGAGFTMQLQDRRRHAAVPGRAGAGVHAGRPPAAGDRPHRHLYRASVPQIYADIDRSKVLKAGRPLNDVNTTLGALLGSSYVNDFNRFGRVYKVYVQAEPEYRQDPKQLGLFFVRSAGGDGAARHAGATRPTQGPEFTNRFNLFRSAELTGVPAPGYSSGQALAPWRRWRAQVLPPDMGYDWADMSYQEKKRAPVAVVFAVAILLVFLVLAAQYESWGCRSACCSARRSPPSAPTSASGWRAVPRPSYVNNVFAQIGLIMLIGFAAKNAI